MLLAMCIMPASENIIFIHKLLAKFLIHRHISHRGAVEVIFLIHRCSVEPDMVAWAYHEYSFIFFVCGN